VDKTREVLPSAYGVRRLEVGTPADKKTQEHWDVSITLLFNTLEDVERYKPDPVHRAYVDVFLKPMLQTIRAWNFDITARGQG